MATLTHLLLQIRLKFDSAVYIYGILFFTNSVTHSLLEPLVLDRNVMIGRASSPRSKSAHESHFLAYTTDWKVVQKHISGVDVQAILCPFQ